MSSYTHVIFSLFNIKSFDHHRHKIPPHWTNMTEKAMTAVTSSQQRIMAKTFSTDKGTKGIISIKSPLRCMMESTVAGKLTAVNDTLKQQETNNVHQVDPRRALEPSQQRQERS